MAVEMDDQGAVGVAASSHHCPVTVIRRDVPFGVIMTGAFRY